MGEFLITYVVIGTVPRHSPNKERKDGDRLEKMIGGCQQQKKETPFYYGRWDEGLTPGPMDGVRSATVTFTKDEVLETEVIKGRGEVQLPSMAYKLMSQSTDGSIEIQYLDSYYPLKSTLKRGENGTLIWEQNSQTKKMTRIESKTGKEETYEK